MNIWKILVFISLLFVFVFFGFFAFGLNWFSGQSVVIEPQKINNPPSHKDTARFAKAPARRAGQVKNTFTANLETNASNILEIPELSKNPKDISIKISAESAISTKIVNNEIKILFEKDKDKRLPIASLTKLMTALVVLEKYDLNQMIAISSRAMIEMGEQGNLKTGEVLSVKNLLYIMLIESSNRAAYALSEIIGNDQFIAEMNNEAKLIGMPNTYFIDNTGLDPNSYSTVTDLVNLTKHLLRKHPLFEEILGLKIFNLYVNHEFHHKLINTNQLLGENGIIGGKTGFTDEAQGCFIAIQKDIKNENYFINVILGAEDRFLEMKKLINLNI